MMWEDQLLNWMFSKHWSIRLLFSEKSVKVGYTDSTAIAKRRKVQLTYVTSHDIALQMAPFDMDYKWPNSSGTYSLGTQWDSEMNEYRGGIFQQVS